MSIPSYDPSFQFSISPLTQNFLDSLEITDSLLGNDLLDEPLHAPFLFQDQTSTETFEPEDRTPPLAQSSPKISSSESDLFDAPSLPFRFLIDQENGETADPLGIGFLDLESDHIVLPSLDLVCPRHKTPPTIATPKAKTIPTAFPPRIENAKENFDAFTYVSYINANGEAYEGQYLNGLKHGFGACMYPDGSHYRGQWVKNQRQGNGTCTYLNGERFTGQWVNDKKHGIGKYFYPNGEYYTGHWLNNQRANNQNYFS